MGRYYNFYEIETRIREELNKIKGNIIEINEFEKRIKLALAKEVVRQKFELEYDDDIDDKKIEEAIKYIKFLKFESFERNRYYIDGVWSEVEALYILYLLNKYDLSHLSNIDFIDKSVIDEILEKHRFVVAIRCIIDKLNNEEKQYIKLREITELLVFE
jgi:hypothetical protein